MNKLKKIILCICCSVVGLLIGVYLLLLVINWRDQPPSAAALALEKIVREEPVAADDENAYVYLMGFSVAKGEDPLQWGKVRTEWLRTQTPWPAQLQGELPGEHFEFKSELPTQLNAVLDSCKTLDQACTNALTQYEASLALQLESEPELLKRYQKLLQYTQLVEPVPLNISAPMPAFALVFEGQRQLLIQSWLAAGQGDVERVRTLLQNDVVFWRHALRATNALITKMIAVAALKRHFSWAHIILRRIPPHKITQVIPQSWTTPLTPEELSLRRCWAAEYQFNLGQMLAFKSGLTGLNSFAREETKLEKLFIYVALPMLQEQDSLNQYAQFLLDILQIFDVPLGQYSSAHEQAKAFENNKATLFASRAYNFLGDYVMSRDNFNLSSYITRVADIEGLRRLTLLSAQLTGNAIAQQDIAQAVAISNYKNPYTEAPFQWDEHSGSLVFDGLEGGERGHNAWQY